jgi:hypothetical protein
MTPLGRQLTRPQCHRNHQSVPQRTVLGFSKGRASVTVASLRNYKVLQPIPAARLDELQEKIGASRQI